MGLDHGGRRGPPKSYEVTIMKVDLSDEDIEHLKDWQRLSYAEKEALNKLAKHFGNEERRESLYELIKLQNKISGMIAAASHLSFLWAFFLRIGVATGIITSILLLLQKWAAK